MNAQELAKELEAYRLQNINRPMSRLWLELAELAITLMEKK